MTDSQGDQQGSTPEGNKPAKKLSTRPATSLPKRRGNTWRNWSGGVTETSQLAAGPTSETAVRALVIGAGGSGLKVKTVGSGHSFNDIAGTEGLRLHFDDYRGLVSVNSQTRVATFRAGTRMHEVHDLLAEHGLTLENQGDVSSPTIAGAISTGTHGTGLGTSGLSSMVKGLRLVLANGEIIYCDARTHPEIFEFARLGLGALGIIVEVAIQCVPTFRVEANESAEPLDAVLDSYVERARAADYFSFFWFPHSEQALVKSHRRLAEGEEPEGLGGKNAAKFFDEELVQYWAQGLAASVGTVAPGMVQKLSQFTSSLTGSRQYVEDSVAMFGNAKRMRYNELEYAVPLEDGPDVVHEIRRQIEAHGLTVSFPIEVRCGAADDVPLSPGYGRETAYIAVHRYVRERYAEYFGVVEEVLQSAGGRPHWGMMHTLRAPQLRELYPKFDEFVELRDRVDPDRVFDNHYLERTIGE
ncbi:D-arabinono-1,4-lactone oxidase [Gulosibacter chungangensis]|uniref:FAD-binding protein n=1 Tax=Gulosibacter chungangensis TaxID=979746 RepID=A0A7J5B9M3_9MICO|nr:D-arabinono-1,4-lactone oxidase [Gulosibacter chungangensis]KAB1642265.1 FAD-binding protein [Gulosibacter chungangensis]